MNAEAEFQKSCVNWFKTHYPNELIAYINNNSCSISQGRKNREMGILKGAPDLFVFHPNKVYGGLAIELKTATGRLSPAQIDVHDRLSKAGYFVVVVRSLESFQSLVSTYMQEK